MGAVGSGLISRPDRPLIGDVPHLGLRDLPAFGKTVEMTWTGAANVPSTRVTRAGWELVLEADGEVLRVAMTSTPMPRGRGARWRLTCPRCSHLRDDLYWYAGEWGCRGCHGLDYACRHSLRWHGGRAIRRKARLLKKLARTPSTSSGRLRARLLQAQIAVEERAILASLQRANSDLTKRSRQHGRSGRASSD